MTFDHPMMVGMEQSWTCTGAHLGPIEPISCTWSSDRLTVTCQPAQALQHNAQYTFHAGGGMMDADDHPIHIGPHGTQMGGQWLMPGMMGGMHAGMPMSGWAWVAGGERQLRHGFHLYDGVNSGPAPGGPRPAKGHGLSSALSFSVVKGRDTP